MAKNYKKPSGLLNKIKDWSEPNFSEGALKILEKRYLDKNDSGELTETPKEMLYRVASVIAGTDEKKTHEFYEIMARGEFLPNSPTLKGAGLGINLSACYKIPIEDSREGIFREALYEAIDIQAHGGGVGLNFSNLRPEGSLISTTKGKSSGPIPFMEIIDLAVGRVIAQGGTRQGASMGILNYNHPDIEKFITCKQDGGITNFNISVGVTEEFMEMVKKGEDYALIDHKGREVRKVNAKEIWGKIIKNAWQNGDPGVIFLDRLERDNPTPAVGKIDGTNPCGEQPLLDYESCNLGSINLAQFEQNGKINYKELRKVIHTAVHFLDNVIDVNAYPLKRVGKEVHELESILEKKVKNRKTIDSILEEFSQSPIEKIVKANRKIGLGVMGFANMLAELGIAYGSEESYKVADKVMKFIDDESKKASEKIAEEKGVFPNWKESVYNSESTYYKGKELKLRNATTTTIAPTGTLSILAGVEGGIEPLYALVLEQGSVYDKEGHAQVKEKKLNENFRKIATKEKFYSQKLIEEIFNNHGSLRGVKKPENVSEERWKQLQEIFVTAHDLPVEAHVEMQSVFQKHVDNAVSKTVNAPANAPKELVEKAFWLAYEKRLKGITIYRDGSKNNQVKTTGSTKKNLETITASFDNPLKVSAIMPAIKIRQQTPAGNIHMEIVVNPANNYNAVEVFAELGNAGSEELATMEAFGRLVSYILRSGGKIENAIAQLKDIGSGSSVITRDGGIHSLAQGFAKGLMKFVALREFYNIEDFLLGKLEFEKLDNEISDYLRTRKRINEFEKNRLPEEPRVFVPIEKNCENGNCKKEVYSDKCPECRGELEAGEGCVKCRSCGFNKCGG